VNITLRQLVLASSVLAVTAAFSLPSLAQDVRREDMVTYFQMNQIDHDKDGMVSKKEFMDMMSKAWDTHMADAAKMGAANAPATKTMKDKMTREQYIEFSKMFGLNIGG
jgi:hypothetical protein